MGLLAAPKVLVLQQQILFDADPFTLQEVTKRVLPNQRNVSHIQGYLRLRAQRHHQSSLRVA